jgi:hypothetical protein
MRDGVGLLTTNSGHELAGDIVAKMRCWQYRQPFAELVTGCRRFIGIRSSDQADNGRAGHPSALTHDYAVLSAPGDQQKVLYDLDGR